MNTKETTPPDSQQQMGMRWWNVSGIAFVPAHVEMLVEATSQEEAVSKAKTKFDARTTRRADYVVGRSHDDSAVWGWENLEAEAVKPHTVRISDGGKKT